MPVFFVYRQLTVRSFDFHKQIYTSGAYHNIGHASTNLVQRMNAKAEATDGVYDFLVIGVSAGYCSHLISLASMPRNISARMKAKLITQGIGHVSMLIICISGAVG